MARVVAAWAPVVSLPDALHPFESDDCLLQRWHLVLVAHHTSPVLLLVPDLRVDVLS